MASPDAITLPEEQPVAVPAAEVRPPDTLVGLTSCSAPPVSLLCLSAQFQGEELMEQHQDTLDALLAQPDHFFEGVWFPTWPKGGGQSEGRGGGKRKFLVCFPRPSRRPGGAEGAGGGGEGERRGGHGEEEEEAEWTQAGVSGPHGVKRGSRPHTLTASSPHCQLPASSSAQRGRRSEGRQEVCSPHGAAHPLLGTHAPPTSAAPCCQEAQTAGVAGATFHRWGGET